MTDTRSQDLPEQVGPYRIDGSLGVGGMGAVYRAWDARLRRPVAIKHVLPDRVDDRARRRLRREAQAVAGLNHPSIVQIFDIVETETVDWIVMELVEGQNLHHLIDSGRLGLAEAVVLAREITEGLAEAHEKGIVHRDLKAENVMVSRSFHAKILDFGLAKRMWQPADASLSDLGSVIGTGRAMSPEQAMGEEVDHRSDLFSLGSLIYEAVTGQPAFSGTSVFKTLAKVCGARHTAARQVNRRVPVELSNLVDRLLEKNPEHRPQSAREVVVELRQIEKMPLPEWGGPYTWESSGTAEADAWGRLGPFPAFEDIDPLEAPPPESPPGALRLGPLRPGAPRSATPHSATPAQEDDDDVVEPPRAEIQPFRRPSDVTEEMPAYGDEPLPAQDPREPTAEVPAFPAGEEDAPPSGGLRLRTVLALRPVGGDPAQRRSLAAARRRLVRGHEGETAGDVDLFPRPLLALRAALSILDAADDLGLDAAAALHLDEVLLATAEDDAPLRAQGPGLRAACDLADAARPGQVLVTPEARSLARRALLQDRVPDRAAWHEHGRFYLRALEEALPVAAVASSPRRTETAPRETDAVRRVPDRSLRVVAGS